MSYHPGDTICAIATPPGGAARGMVRVSGPDAVAIVSRCFRADDDSSVEQVKCARAVSGQVRVALCTQHKSAHSPLPPSHRGAEIGVPCHAFIWPNARSYTREPVVELHTLGSPPLLESILATLCRAGARLAEAGEFTLRAFLAGRLDLTQAEAVLGVIDARGDDELDAALVQLAGGLAEPLHKLRRDLLQLLAELEAALDFAEEDIEFASPAEILRRLAEAGQLLDRLAAQMSSRHTSNRHQQIALVGPPNVGKSSLFNALIARCGVRSAANEPITRAAALVSPERGTTRDYLIATISLDGVSCELVDTAGIDDPRDIAAQHAPHPSSQKIGIDGAAQALAVECGTRATVRAHCVIASDFARSSRFESKPLPQAADERRDVVVLTKCDLLERSIQVPADAAANAPVIPTSSRTGEGLDELCALLRKLLIDDQFNEAGITIPATANRCRESIRLAAAALRAASDTVLAGGGSELVAVEIRAALEELGQVVGAVYTDDLLDRIFSTFCIGK
jgi:tRNA modification GTPase